MTWDAEPLVLKLSFRISNREYSVQISARLTKNPEAFVAFFSFFGQIYKECHEIGYG
jgi:hypothetical protein